MHTDLPDNIFVQEDLSKPVLRSPAIYLLMGGLALYAGLYTATQLFPAFASLHSLPSTSAGALDASIRQSMRFLSIALGAMALCAIPFSVWYAQQPKTPPLRPLLATCILLLGAAPLAYGFSQPETYTFYDYLRWLRMWHQEEALLMPFVYSASSGTFVFLFLFGGFVMGVTGQKYAVSRSYGSAGWGNGQWFAQGQPQTRLGRFLSSASEYGFPVGWKDNRMLYDRTGLHAYVQAPTGSGKSRGFVIPTLLLHRGSVLAIDIKRELYHVTSKRRFEINASVHRLDPFARDIETAKYNPLDFVETTGDDADTAADDANLIANMIVVETGKENNPFFVRSARQMLAGLILYVACFDLDDVDVARKRNLGHVRSLLMQDNEVLRDLFHSMGTAHPSEGESVTGPVAAVLGTGGAGASSHVTRIVAETGNQFSKMNDKEFTSVVSTAREQSRFLSSSRIQRALSETTFQFSEMRTNDRGSSIYLCLPDDRLETYFRWLRLMIVSAQIELTRLDPQDIVFEPTALFMLEEFPRLSKMKEIDKGVSLHRSYGIQYVIIAQSLNQLIDVYGDDMASNLRENCQLKIAWAPDSQTSAKEISEMCGMTTVATTSDSKNKSRSKGAKGGGSNRSVSQSIQEKERALVTPDEARRTPPDFAFVITRSQHPMIVRRPDYVTDDLFDGMADPHPQYGTPTELDAARRRRLAAGYETPIRRDPDDTSSASPPSSASSAVASSTGGASGPISREATSPEATSREADRPDPDAPSPAGAPATSGDSAGGAASSGAPSRRPTRPEAAPTPSAPGASFSLLDDSTPAAPPLRGGDPRDQDPRDQDRPSEDPGSEDPRAQDTREEQMQRWSSERSRRQQQGQSR